MRFTIYDLRFTIERLAMYHSRSPNRQSSIVNRKSNPIVDRKSFFDLQLFAAEDEGRTEAPTGKRIGKARSEGQVAKSQELTQTLGLFVGVLVLVTVLPKTVGYELKHLKYFLQNLSTLELSEHALRNHFLEIFFQLAFVLWPIALAEILVSIGSNMAQVGWFFSWEPLKPKWNKIFPDPKRVIDRILIGKTVFFNLFKSTMKVAFIAWIAYVTILDHMPQLLSTWGMTPYGTLALVADVAYEVVKRVCIFLLTLAIADYAFNRYQWKDSLKMKKEEVKDEAKQAEGDPQIKQAQRKRMLMASRRRMMREIPTADVIITNPTHFSVAIKYDALMLAPKVIAKGEGFIALKIRQIAGEHGIPLVENKTLAQALYKAVDIGAEVPAQFYRAVAEVLAQVYRMKQKAGMSGAIAS